MQTLERSVSPIMATEDSFFTAIGNTKPYFKAAFEGEPGTGKSWTAALVAIGLHKKIGSKKPIVLIDTEKASKFLVPLFREHGIEAMVRETHSLADLVKAMKLCSDGYSDIMVIDSITHIWMDFQEAYKKKLNRQVFQIQDWMSIKSEWNKYFSIPLVQSPLHILATGRVSDRMEQEVDEDGRKEFTKTGVKMQAEKNAAYEFDVLVLMERHELIQRKKREVWRQSIVLKGRGNLLDGAVFKNPTYEDFAPAIEAIIKDPIAARFSHASQDAGELIKTEEDKREWVRSKKRWLEEIEGYLVSVWPSSSAAEKKNKTDALEYAFQTRSWSAIEGMQPDILEDGYARVLEFGKQKVAEAKGELVPEPTPAEKFDKDLRDSKEEKPKRPKVNADKAKKGD
ncbi:MAG: AAA family ATPase [Candidatus Jorgensenbacteria bacterium]|nr:AAA family ATPase [Candidatus Jorgensenbacteria bacterium]